MTISTLDGTAWAAIASVDGTAKASIASIDGEAAPSGAPAGIAQRGATQVSSGTSPRTVNKPAGVVSGDVLIAIQGSNGADPTLSSGFTNLSNATGGDGYKYRVSYKVCGGSEPSTYDFGTTGNASSLPVILSAWSGADNSTPFEGATAAAVSSNTNPFVTASITASLDNSLWFTFFIDDEVNRTIATPPAGHTEVGSSFDGAGHLAMYQKAVGAGATGTASLLWSSGTWGSNGAFIMRPATP